MKSNIFKMFSLVLVITAVVSLASCGRTTDNGTTNNPGNTTSNSANNDATTGNESNSANNDETTGNESTSQSEVGKMGEDVKDATKQGMEDVKDATRNVGDAMDGKKNNNQ